MCSVKRSGVLGLAWGRVSMGDGGSLALSVYIKHNT